MTMRSHTFILLTNIYYIIPLSLSVISRTTARSTRSCFYKCLIMSIGFFTHYHATTFESRIRSRCSAGTSAYARAYTHTRIYNNAPLSPQKGTLISDQKTLILALNVKTFCPKRPVLRARKSSLSAPKIKSFFRLKVCKVDKVATRLVFNLRSGCRLLGLSTILGTCTRYNTLVLGEQTKGALTWRTPFL